MNDFLSYNDIFYYPSTLHECPLIRRYNPLHNTSHSLSNYFLDNFVSEIAEANWPVVIEVAHLLGFWDKDNESHVEVVGNMLKPEAFLHKFDRPTFHHIPVFPIENSRISIWSRAL